MPPTKIIRFYRTPALSEYKKNILVKAVKERAGISVQEIESEYCFNAEVSAALSAPETETLRWLLCETFEPENFSENSLLGKKTPKGYKTELFEAGPRMNFSTAWSTNAVSICHACGLKKIKRIERSRRYRLILPQDSKIQRPEFLALVHDRMTECEYQEPITTFDTGIKPERVFTIPIIEEGRSALIEINQKMGLGLDDWDIDYYYNLFKKELGRNPTNVECFDLSQSNSEHSRHWFFGGRLVIDGKEVSGSLMQIVKEPHRRHQGNSVIAFKDNSSAIKGFAISTIIPSNPRGPSHYKKIDLDYHLIFTAETHNFPSGIAPFPGAETGTGGRIRDVHATGKGSLVVAGTAAYCVGNLFLPNYPLQWEHGSLIYPQNLASPLQILIEASNGASDYGNKFGEPLIQGFTRSFGLKLPDGERSEWLKPIMFTGGVGQIDARHIEKDEPEKGMVVVKIGGPAYRIGMGGGAASSMIQGENVAELDFNAVQRGDAEMEQKVNRVIRTCVELGDSNPIISIHDQGAGGNCNVVKEIIYPAGGRIEIRKIIIGDNTLSVLEIWGAEYQEQDALLIHESKTRAFKDLCSREKVPVAVIGKITGDGNITLFDEEDSSIPVNLNLEQVLGEMPRKTFNLERMFVHIQPLRLPENITIMDALERVLRLVSVGSKRFLTNKVDRSVTGLIARQQCVGPLQLSLSNVAVIAQSHFIADKTYTGAAIAIGEQPIKGLIDPSAMARMSVGEALTNIVWAKITALRDIKCSGNWMWAPKLPGEGAKLYDAAVAMKDLMIDLGIAVDGGKDSLSMAAKVGHGADDVETVKSPGTLVISAYAPCPDITKVVTPDIKMPGKSRLIYVDLCNGKNRLGGSALAHCYKQVGDDCPDVDSPEQLKDAFNAIQYLIDQELILAGHDRSDGGLITTILEMAFAGNCGVEIELASLKKTVNIEETMRMLFAEELGFVIEYETEKESDVIAAFEKLFVPYTVIGDTISQKRVVFSINDEVVLDEDMRRLRALWEETSYHLEMLQANPECVLEEKEINYDRKGPDYVVAFDPEQTPEIIIKKKSKPVVAIIREEGSNGDREMSSSFFMAGFDAWDVTMTDLMEEHAALSDFKGVVFVGGFSYADVFDSAKGWAGTIRFNSKLFEQFHKFYQRTDTFSLGVCNGCQLAALLGWVPWQGITDKAQPRFIHNKSGRFESRFTTVKILESPSIMLHGMEGSTLGIWTAHGEGRAHFPDKTILNEVRAKKLAPVRYVDDSGEVTEKYPFNPNSSPLGIAGLCSADGRHLAMMPHPERVTLNWQWGWMPEDMKATLKASPWLKLFQNAREWCDTK